MPKGIRRKESPERRISQQRQTSQAADIAPPTEKGTQPQRRKLRRVLQLCRSERYTVPGNPMLRGFRTHKLPVLCATATTAGSTWRRPERRSETGSRLPGREKSGDTRQAFALHYSIRGSI